MTLRTKTLLIVAATLAGLMGILYLASSTILFGGFLKLERSEARLDVERVQNAVENELSELDALVEDWASWDDTYRFIVDRNRSYVRSNLPVETFSNFELSVMLFVSPLGEVVHGRGFDREEGRFAPYPDGFEEHLEQADPLVGHPSPESSVRGLLLLREGPLLVASRPILTSRGEGPIRGALIMGRYLQVGLVEQLGELTGLTIAFRRLDSPEAAADAPPPGQVPVRSVDDETVVGETTVEDIYGGPILLLRVTSPRRIVSQGRFQIATFTFFLLGSGILFGIAILALLERSVLSRLRSLSRGVAGIARAGQATARLPERGGDELATLTRDINDMIDALAGSRRELEAGERELVRRNAYLAALHETALALMDRLDLSDLLEMIVSRGGKLLDTQHGYLYLVEPNGEEIVVKVGVGALAEYVGFRMRRGEGLAGKVWETGETLAVNDYDVWTGRSAKFDRGVFSAVAGVPLKSGSEVVGVIGMARVEPGRGFDPGELELLDGLAHLASIALDNARLYEAAHRELEERERAQRALEQEKERFRTLSDGAFEGICIHEKGTILEVNRAFAELWGYSPAELVGMDVMSLMADESREIVRGRLEEPQDDPYELVALRKDGQRFIAEVAARWIPYRDRLARVVAVRDITERKRAEEALLESEEKFRTVADTATDSIVSADSRGVIVYVNPAVERMFGYTADEAVGRPLTILMPARFHDPHRAGLKRFLTTGEARVIGTTVELVGRKKDGGEFPVELSLTTWEAAEGAFFTGIIRDVTERKRTEEALQGAYDREHEAADRLRALDQMKNAFLSAVSHELRTPLTSVLGFANILEQPDLRLPGIKRKHLVRRIAANARKLDRLLSDLLDLDRLDRGIIEPNRRPINLADLIRQVVEETDVGDRRVVVDAEEIVADVDAAKVERILENLLSNAAKYTPPGTAVWIRLRGEARGVLLVVEDAGPGVAEEEREAIFEPFQKGRLAVARVPGTGIGLSLVARFAELHGGRAWVEERPGGGSSFRVLLPGRVEAEALQPL